MTPQKVMDTLVSYPSCVVLDPQHRSCYHYRVHLSKSIVLKCWKLYSGGREWAQFKPSIPHCGPIFHRTLLFAIHQRLISNAWKISPFASLAIRFFAFMTETLKEKLARCGGGKRKSQAAQWQTVNAIRAKVMQWARYGAFIVRHSEYQHAIETSVKKWIDATMLHLVSHSLVSHEAEKTQCPTKSGLTQTYSLRHTVFQKGSRFLTDTFEESLAVKRRRTLQGH